MRIVALVTVIVVCAAGNTALAQSSGDAQAWRSDRSWFWHDPNGPVKTWRRDHAGAPPHPKPGNQGLTMFAPLRCKTSDCVRQNSASDDVFSFIFGPPR